MATDETTDTPDEEAATGPEPSDPDLIQPGPGRAILAEQAAAAAEAQAEQAQAEADRLREGAEATRAAVDDG